MKNFVKMGMLLFCAVMVMISCSGDDGEQGPQGPAGIQGEQGPQGPTGPQGEQGEPGPQGPAGQDGADGQDGVDGQDGADGADGQDGADGNANVAVYDISMNDFTGSIYDFVLPVAIEQIPNYIFFFYLKRNSTYYTVPGYLNAGAQYMTLDFNESDATGKVRFFNSSDNSQVNVGLGFFDFFRIVAVEFTMGAKSGQTVIEEIKAAGVDTSDYHQVAAYFGLE